VVTANIGLSLLPHDAIARRACPIQRREPSAGPGGSQGDPFGATPPAMAVAPLSHSARDYVRAFDLVSVCRWRDGRLGVSRNPKGAEQAWWCPAKVAGELVRAANAGGRDVAAAAARLKTPLTDHATVAQRATEAVSRMATLPSSTVPIRHAGRPQPLKGGASSPTSKSR
jgi:hypothetical protein